MARKGNLKRVLSSTLLGVALLLAILIGAPTTASAADASLDEAATATTTPVSIGTAATDASTDDYTTMTWALYDIFPTLFDCREKGINLILNDGVVLAFRCEQYNLGHFLAWALYIYI